MSIGEEDEEKCSLITSHRGYALLARPVSDAVNLEVEVVPIRCFPVLFGRRSLCTATYNEYEWEETLQLLDSRVLMKMTSTW